MILTTLYLAGVKNISSWCARKGDLQSAFPLDVLMVHTSALAVSADGEHLTCGGFSLNETVCFGSLEFIADCFDGMSLSTMRNDLGATFMGSIHSGSPSPLRVMIEDSTEEIYMTSSREGGSSLPSSRRHRTGTSSALVATTPWLEDAPAT
jgi:hypothetical protein